MRELETVVVNAHEAEGYVFFEVEGKKKEGGFQPTPYPSLEGSPVDYVIITNDSLAATFQVLADWKTAKGVPTVVRTTEWIEANYRNGVDQRRPFATSSRMPTRNGGSRTCSSAATTDQIPAPHGRSASISAETGTPRRHVLRLSRRGLERGSRPRDSARA